MSARIAILALLTLAAGLLAGWGGAERLHREAPLPLAASNDFSSRRDELLRPPHSIHGEVAPLEIDERAVNALQDWDQRLQAVIAWSASDATAALLWSTNRSDPEERRAALVAACYGIAENDPAAAVRVAETYLLTTDGQLTANLVEQWAGRDLPAAYAWATSGLSHGNRADLLTRVARVWAQRAPEEAAGMVIEQIPSGPAQDEAMMSVLHQWTLRDEGAALAWVLACQPSPLRTRAIGELEGALALPAPTARGAAQSFSL